MYKILILALIYCIGTASSCQRKKIKPDPFDEFKRNNTNLKLTKITQYKSIQFRMPQHFVEEDRNDFVVRSGDFSGTDSSTNSFFTIESFRLDEWNTLFPGDSIGDEPTLEDMNSAYLYKRYERYFGVGVSHREKLPLRYPNYFQTISAKESEYSTRKYIQCATLVVKDRFYFFQLVTTPVLMKYLADDFKRILNTVKYY